MLVIFKSKAAADVVMYEEHAKRILDLLHKDTKRGVITAAETAGAIAAVEAEIAASRPAGENEAGETSSHGGDKSNPHIGFATRAFPLLEMLRTAHNNGNDVAWGI